MDRFEYRAIRSNIRARRQSKSTYETGTEVTYNVSVKVFGNQDIELLGLSDELHTTVVDNDVVGPDVWILLGGPIKFAQRLRKGDTD